MNSPIETNRFKHYLKFNFLGSEILYRICEPIGFDSATFNIDQNSKRYSRDLKYGSIDKLTFVERVGEFIGVEQVVNPQGTISEYLNYGLEWLLYLYKNDGFEAKCEYILKNGNVEFSAGLLDFTDKNITDGYTYISLKLIQNNKVQDYNRQNDTKFNAFGTRNFKNEVITPAPTLNYLRKSTPIENESIFKGNGTSASALSSVQANIIGRLDAGANNSNKIEKSEINNTLSFISPVYATQETAFDSNGILRRIPNNSGSFQFLEAKNYLSNIRFNFTNINAYTYGIASDVPGTTVTTAKGNAKLVMLVGGIDLESERFDYYELASFNYPNKASFDSVNRYFPSSLSITIPFIERSKRVYIYFVNDVTEATFNNDNNSAIVQINTRVINMDISIKATETAIDTVVKAVRYIDLIKQSSKFLNNIPVNAPLFNVGGEHYNQVVFNRRMVSQKTDYFYGTFKDVLGSVEEVNCDYEIKEDEIFIGHQKDFYENKEIGVLRIIPSKDSSEYFNDRFMCNSFRYGYKTYEQDRTAKNTSQAIHTDSQWIIPNLMVENKKEVSNDFVRDSFSVQQAINLEITEPTTSTDNDDDIFIEEITPIGSGVFGIFGARLLMRIVDGNLEILNRDSNGDKNDVVINWTILGFGVGDTFQITSGQNIGSYTVLTPLTNSNLLLQPIGFSPTFQGDAFIQVKYFYTNVAFKTRTIEGFSQPTTSVLSNLNYSIKRNIFRWGTFINSCMLFKKTTFRNSYFKSNGTFLSRKTGGNVIIESADINYSSLDAPLLTPKILTLSLLCDFNTILEILNRYKTERGFIRCYDTKGKIIKGYIQKLEQNWSKNELKVTLEEKYENDFITLNYIDGKIIVNDVVYGLNGNLNWWKINNLFFQAFDENQIAICNTTKYDKVKLNGVVYNSINELQDALLSL